MWYSWNQLTNQTICRLHQQKYTGIFDYWLFFSTIQTHDSSGEKIYSIFKTIYGLHSIHQSHNRHYSQYSPSGVWHVGFFPPSLQSRLIGEKGVSKEWAVCSSTHREQCDCTRGGKGLGKWEIDYKNHLLFFLSTCSLTEQRNWKKISREYFGVF